MTLAVPYVRVSTDDKGQNPERQVQIIQEWAAREGIHLTRPIIDEGTSASKTNPFERPRFIEACELAKACGAEAIIVETGDRFSRQGTKLSDWAEVEVGLRYGLKLFRADFRLAEIGTLSGDLVAAIKSELAREWVRQHSERVRTGMATKKAAGARFGRPVRELTEPELALAQSIRRAGAGKRGYGWRAIAQRINRDRGAFDVADVAARRRRMVSANTVMRRVREHERGALHKSSVSNVTEEA